MKSSFLFANRNTNMSTRGTIDAIIRIECFGDRKYTPVKKGLGNGAQVWNEHFFFNSIIDVTSIIKKQQQYL